MQEDKPGPVLDTNVYTTKKTIAQGMLDVALLTANASQLKYLLQLGKAHEFYYLMVTLISLSLVLQVSINLVNTVDDDKDDDDDDLESRNLLCSLTNIAILHLSITFSPVKIKSVRFRIMPKLRQY